MAQQARWAAGRAGRAAGAPAGLGRLHLDGWTAWPASVLFWLGTPPVTTGRLFADTPGRRRRFSTTDPAGGGWTLAGCGQCLPAPGAAAAPASTASAREAVAGSSAG